jgi:hypothetical protein
VSAKAAQVPLRVWPHGRGPPPVVPMPTAEIGPWEFFVPDGWGFKDQGTGISYLEAPEGDKGMYAKTVVRDITDSTARKLADWIQAAHQRGFEADPESDWHVAEQRGAQEGELYRSALDLLDHQAGYRVLSVVLCDWRQAVQITLHDYVCNDYEAVKDSFASVEQSVRKVAGAG